VRVVYAASESAPLVKTGGLADVAGALPAALRDAGIDVRVVLPGYPAVQAGVQKVRKAGVVGPLGQIPAADLVEVALPGGVPGWIVDNPALYDRVGGPYQGPSGSDWPDNALRFGLLSLAAASLADARPDRPWTADVVHANDWQTGLAAAFGALGITRRAPSVFTVHNLAFQGVFPAGQVADLGLPPSSFDVEGVEYYGHLSFLKAGLYYADALTTVSPTYAAEIQSEPGGMGLHGLLADRRGRLTGILNGIDTVSWDPRTDPFLSHPYDADHLDDKRLDKRALQVEAGLDPDDRMFLLGVVARISDQKGIDLIVDAGASIARLPAQLVVLGSGDHALEQRLLALAAAHPRHVRVVIGFDEGLAHRIEAGADAFVMPSRFEPCGLNQMYSQRYGTPPIVHATGGLVDSVVDHDAATLAAGTATGFAYRGSSAASLLRAIERALATYRDEPTWRRLQRNGMARDFGWSGPAAQYAALYERLARARPGSR
jgi:starch synthase